MTEDAAEAPPTSAASLTFCPFLNKRGRACMSEPLKETGICREHSKKAAAVVGGLLG